MNPTMVRTDYTTTTRLHTRGTRIKDDITIERYFRRHEAFTAHALTIQMCLQVAP